MMHFSIIIFIILLKLLFVFFFSSRRRHTRWPREWSSDVCSSDLRPLEQESSDGDDTLNWIARQSWSDGKVGMIGGSYRGIVQWKAAVLNNPHLKAIFPVVAGDDEYRDRFYSPGGALKLGHRLEWMSENQKAPGYHPDFGKYTLHLPLRTSDIAATGWISDMFRQAIAH